MPSWVFANPNPQHLELPRPIAGAQAHLAVPVDRDGFNFSVAIGRDNCMTGVNGDSEASEFAFMNMISAALGKSFN